jgi:hypothetical protein
MLKNKNHPSLSYPGVQKSRLLEKASAAGQS